MNESEILQLLLDGKTLALMIEDSNESYRDYQFSTLEEYRELRTKIRSNYSGTVHIVQIERYVIATLYPITMKEKMIVN